MGPCLILFPISKAAMSTELFLTFKPTTTEHDPRSSLTSTHNCHIQSVTSIVPPPSDKMSEPDHGKPDSEEEDTVSLTGTRPSEELRKKAVSYYEPMQMSQKSVTALEYVPHRYSHNEMNVEEKMRLDRKVMGIFDRLNRFRSNLEMRRAEKEQIMKNSVCRKI